MGLGEFYSLNGMAATLSRFCYAVRLSGQKPGVSIMHTAEYESYGCADGSLMLN